MTQRRAISQKVRTAVRREAAWERRHAVAIITGGAITLGVVGGLLLSWSTGLLAAVLFAAIHATRHALDGRAGQRPAVEGRRGRSW